MKSAIKKCYSILDLPYNATIEDVRLRQKMLIKLINAKSLKNGKNYNKQIRKINLASEKIVFNINKYGIASKNCKTYESDLNNVFNVVFAFGLVTIFAVVSFLIIL